MPLTRFGISSNQYGDPFAIGPPGDSSSRLLAKSMNINLQINKLYNHPLQNLNAKILNVLLDETFILCLTRLLGFAVGFERRVDLRESEERRLMAGEAAKALSNQREMKEGKEKWCARMRETGFVGEKFSEDNIDGARTLLKRRLFCR